MRRVAIKNIVAPVLQKSIAGKGVAVKGSFFQHAGGFEQARTGVKPAQQKGRVAHRLVGQLAQRVALPVHAQQRAAHHRGQVLRAIGVFEQLHVALKLALAQQGAAKALHGQDIVNNRTKIKRRIQLIDFQEDLTSLCASNLEPKDLPHFDFNKNLKLERAYNRKTILLMNRSAAYKKIQESPELHAYRNFDFEVISSAITKVDDKDIDFIRIGVPDGLSTKNERILDARTELQRNAELDLKIQTEAFAYFGADSGPAWLAHCMNKSVAYINMIPLNQDSPTEPKKLIVIPKILFWEKENRVLTLAEMLSPEISAIRNTAEYSRHGIKPINNSFEDVSNFLSDWIDMLLGISNCVDEEQMKFIRSTHKLPNLPSIHRRFLQNHPELLPV